MRLPPIDPSRLSAEQRPFYDEMKRGIDAHLKGFVSQRDDGALVGPFNPMLHFPTYGVPAWRFTSALVEHTRLPKPVREVAILAVGAHFGSRYELYAHEHVAESTGLTPAKIATLAAGQRPSDLTETEGAAFDVAASLAGGGPLPESTYRAAVSAFGDDGMAELVYLIGNYAIVSMLLNAYDVSVPGREEGVPKG